MEPRHEAFTPFPGGKSQAQALRRLPLQAHRRESRTSPSHSRKQQFVQSGSQAEACRVIVRHFLLWSTRETMCPALRGSLVEQCSTGSWAVTAVKMVRRRRQAGAWFQLLRSYLSQCNTLHGEDHRRRVEEGEVQRRVRVSGPAVGVFSCGESGGGRIRADPAEGGGTACDGG
jgi:hypothetical protein